MKGENYKISSETICALISLTGLFVSGFLSFLVARFSIKKEIEKMQLLWEREDVIASDDEFAEMVSAVAAYIQSPYPPEATTAASKIAGIRSKETGTLALKLDQLYRNVSFQNLNAIDSSLTEVINEKRKRKSRHLGADD